MQNILSHIAYNNKNKYTENVFDSTRLSSKRSYRITSVPGTIETGCRNYLLSLSINIPFNYNTSHLPLSEIRTERNERERPVIRDGRCILLEAAATSCMQEMCRDTLTTTSLAR